MRRPGDRILHDRARLAESLVSGAMLVQPMKAEALQAMNFAPGGWPMAGTVVSPIRKPWSPSCGDILPIALVRTLK